MVKLKTEKRMRKILMLISLVLLLLCLFAGCAIQGPQQPPSSSSSTPESSQSSHISSAPSSSSPLPSSTAGTGTELGIEEAKTIALQHAGLSASEVTFVKEQRDFDDGRLKYEIEFVTNTERYDYEIQADNGNVQKSSREPIEHIPANMQGKDFISVDEAKEAALAYAKLSADEVTFTKIELEYEDGQPQYEVDFFSHDLQYSVTLHASSGMVLEMETDVSK